jgi:hypothetical protein
VSRSFKTLLEWDIVQSTEYMECSPDNGTGIAFKGLDMSNGVVIDVLDSWYASMFEPLGQLVCMATVGNG